MKTNPFKLTDLIRCGDEFLDGVFDNITNGITITDENSTILYVNTAFTKITGYSKNEAVGNNPGILHSGRHNKDYYITMWGSIHENGSWSGEIWNRHKSGALLPEWITITKIQSINKTYFIAIFSDITTLVNKTKEKLNLAYTDPLTGLYNRAYLEETFAFLKNKIDERKTTSSIALLFIDVNKFKSINDTYGHLAGDKALKHVSDLIKIHIRKSDIAARYGGDEFVLVLNNVRLKQEIIEICDRIHIELNQPLVYENNIINIALSIGVALYPADATNFNDLVQLADKAMYYSKTNAIYLTFSKD